MKSIFNCFKKYLSSNPSVAVLDDCFPNLLTGFRVAEYNWYLEHMTNVTVYSTNADFESFYSQYSKRYPALAKRVKKYSAKCLKNVDFVYLNFVNNAFLFISDLEKYNIPFVMTLYPGGGFALGEAESDKKIDRILGSKLLSSVVATQRVTVEYLKNKCFSAPVHYIYGGAMNELYFDTETAHADNENREIVKNICFVADKYMPMGVNKGYPHFVETAKMLIKAYPRLKFFVVGGFSYDDYELGSELEQAIEFKGHLFTNELYEFYKNQDVIVSPNEPFKLSPGNFDGFPTGCCIEASLAGVAVVCTDVLKLNEVYDENREIMICKPEPASVYECIKKLIDNPVFFKNIAKAGQAKSRELFNPYVQIRSRADLIDKFSKSRM